MGFYGRCPGRAFCSSQASSCRGQRMRKPLANRLDAVRQSRCPRLFSASWTFTARRRLAVARGNFEIVERKIPIGTSLREGPRPPKNPRGGGRQRMRRMGFLIMLGTNRELFGARQHKADQKRTNSSASELRHPDSSIRQRSTDHPTTSEEAVSIATVGASPPVRVEVLQIGPPFSLPRLSATGRLSLGISSPTACLPEAR
jgi:hypothetical protein